MYNKYVSAIAFESVVKEVHPASALEGSGTFRLASKRMSDRFSSLTDRGARRWIPEVRAGRRRHQGSC